MLVDHVWPRGVSKQRAALDEWARELAPSDELRRWFDHVPERFPQFRARSIDELSRHRERINDLSAHARRRRVTILYAARDREHNNAIVVCELIRDS